MTPFDLFEQCRRSGVILGMDGLGRLAVRGDEAEVYRLLPAIRQHKPGLLRLLASGKNAPAPGAWLPGNAAEPPTGPDWDDMREFAEERAAIMEYDGGMPRTQAVREAIRRACVKYRLTDLYGDPPAPGGGFAIGADSESTEDLKTELLNRYGGRLLSLEIMP